MRYYGTKREDDCACTTFQFNKLAKYFYFIYTEVEINYRDTEWNKTLST